MNIMMWRRPMSRTRSTRSQSPNPKQVEIFVAKTWTVRRRREGQLSQEKLMASSRQVEVGPLDAWTAMVHQQLNQATQKKLKKLQEAAPGPLFFGDSSLPQPRQRSIKALELRMMRCLECHPDFG